jgi:uncharacterized protein YjbI with pentapeptide repeats
MAGKNQKIATPSVPVLALSDLERIDADRLGPGASLSGVELADADLEGRDLTGLHVLEGRWSGIDLANSNVTDARFIEMEFVRVTSYNLRARKATFSDCDVIGSRIASADFFAGALRTVRFTHCKIGYLSFSEARVSDLLFEDCTIDELDFTGAKVDRVAFAKSTAQTLNLAVESARDLDLRTLQIERLSGTRSLRGVIIDDEQLIQFAPVFAGQLGARVA